MQEPEARPHSGPEQPELPDSKARALSVIARWMPFFFAAAVVFLLFVGISSLDKIRALTGKFMQVLSPVLYGIALAYLCNPIHVFFKRHLDRALFKKKGRTQKRAKFSRGAATALTLITLLLILFVLGYVIGPGLYNSLSDMIKNLPSMLNDAEKWMSDMHLDVSWAGSFETFITDALTSLQESLEKAIPSAVGSIVSALTSGIVSVVYQVVSLVIGLVVMIYVLAEKERFARQAKMILFASFSTERADDILSAARHGNHIFSSFIEGKLLDSLVVGIICAVFMLITRMPYWMLISFIIGFTNIIPYFGPIIGAIPTTILVFLNDPKKGIIFLIGVIVIQQIDGNILGPRILGNTTGISTFWVTVSLLVFGWAFGITGMILGVPLFAVIYYLISRTVRKKLAKKGLPCATEEWDAIRYVDPATGTPISSELPIEKAEEQLYFNQQRAAH